MAKKQRARRSSEEHTTEALKQNKSVVTFARLASRDLTRGDCASAFANLAAAHTRYGQAVAHGRDAGYVAKRHDSRRYSLLYTTDQRFVNQCIRRAK